MGTFEDRYVDYAEQYFSKYALMIDEYFQDIKMDIRRANLGFTLTEYLSVALMSAVLVFAILTPLLSVIVGLMLGTVSGIIAGLITGLFIGLFGAVAVFMGFYLYPSVEVSRRRDNINHNLPFATMYLSTVAGTGTPAPAMFKMLASFDEYGEVAKESERISRDVYNFGADLDEALKNAAERTPSEKFKELLWGINSVITTGGDLRAFLREKTDSYMTDYRRELDQFTDTLSLLVEMYITMVIVGSVFMMILSTIMSALGTSQFLVLALQMGTTFLLLPLASIMFIIIVKGSSPME